ncbi:MAG: hypothetical protein CK425_02005 [Parachlamydia sp.]|nr:MAG: hypothetical protein CK425_02005 [Parachlamydia sp.]
MIDWATISLKEMAGFLSEELRKKGIDTVLVGGACVTIYSKNRYQSYDLDYVTYVDMRKVKKALGELGFREKDRYFQHEGCQWLVEFVSPPIAVGNESIQKFNDIITSLGTIKLLKPVDSVKDRLSSFYHWHDKQGLEQAINICLEQEIDFNELERWSIAEKQESKFKMFKELLNKRSRT